VGTAELTVRSDSAFARVVENDQIRMFAPNHLLSHAPRGKPVYNDMDMVNDLMHTVCYNVHVCTLRNALLIDPPVAMLSHSAHAA
jgi:hypothetical protein